MYNSITCWTFLFLPRNVPFEDLVWGTWEAGRNTDSQSHGKTQNSSLWEARTTHQFCSSRSQEVERVVSCHRRSSCNQMNLFTSPLPSYWRPWPLAAPLSLVHWGKDKHVQYNEHHEGHNITGQNSSVLQANGFHSVNLCQCTRPQSHQLMSDDPKLSMFEFMTISEVIFGQVHVIILEFNWITAILWWTF